MDVAFGRLWFHTNFAAAEFDRTDLNIFRTILVKDYNDEHKSVGYERK